MDLADINKIKEVVGAENAQELINKGWVLLDKAPGYYEEGTPYFLYSMGKFRDSQENIPDWN